ncbi:MAG TPA: ACP phosphodiesterase [Xanthomonadales bacterium]|nr:ACP phosphodiesterase [Xanthomonadales bacterium]
MNFLAHLLLAGDDDGLRLGAMLGDFIRGNPQNSNLPAMARQGILLHRYIDQHIDSLPDWTRLREQFPATFRRYSGIIIDLAFDHELALRWREFSSVPLTRFDHDIRQLLARHKTVVPDELWRFMRYADERGLFASYCSAEEILFSLEGIGQRLSRPNPLHRVAEIWHEMKPEFSRGFSLVFPQVQAAVDAWLLEPRTVAWGG